MRRLAEGLPISSRLIREMHAALMRSSRGTGKSPGEHRGVQNWVGGPTPSADELVPPPPLFIEPCIADLERLVNDVPEPQAPLIKAALAHAQQFDAPQRLRMATARRGGLRRRRVHGLAW